MKAVTRDVDPADVRDLLERPPRACISFAGEHGPECAPIVLLWRDGRYLVGVREGVVTRPASRQEVVLLVDDGIDWFDLRAIYVRGLLTPVDRPADAGAGAGHGWFEVVPTKTVAWDYGQLREVRG